jgi:hypothetical protein
MSEVEKPASDLVSIAARAMTHPNTLTPEEIQRLGGRVMADEKHDPEPHKA